jgi:hypothetical protein
LRIEGAHAQVKKSKLDPQFRRWDGQGAIGVQLQGGLSVTDAHGCQDSRLRIEVPDHKGRCRVHLRVGSAGPGRAPVWATFWAILHRPLPGDGRIMWAWAQRRRLGTRWRWELCLALESMAFGAPPRVSGPQHTACINLGWRLLPSGDIRVGYLVGSDGEKRELTLPRIIRDKLDHADSLRAIRDRNLDAVKAALANVDWSGLPEELRTQAATLQQWKSHERLTRFIREWSRITGEVPAEIAWISDAFTVADAWRRQNRHLYQWEAHERSKAFGRRLDYYRQIATTIARQYTTVRVNKIDLRTFQQLRGDPAHDQEPAQRQQRTIAALAELRSALQLCCSNNGATFVEAPAVNITVTCHVCSGQCTWDRAAELVHVCEHCGAEWDQDENAARNIGLFAAASAAE